MISPRNVTIAIGLLLLAGLAAWYGIRRARDSQFSLDVPATCTKYDGLNWCIPDTWKTRQDGDSRKLSSQRADTPRGMVMEIRIKQAPSIERPIDTARLLRLHLDRGDPGAVSDPMLERQKQASKDKRVTIEEAADTSSSHELHMISTLCDLTSHNPIERMGGLMAEPNSQQVTVAVCIMHATALIEGDDGLVWADADLLSWPPGPSANMQAAVDSMNTGPLSDADTRAVKDLSRTWNVIVHIAARKSPPASK